jgi:hypothetical protein
VPSKRLFSGPFAPFRPIAEQLLKGGERPPARDFQGAWLIKAAIREDRPDSRPIPGGAIARSLHGRSEWARFSAAFE